MINILLLDKDKELLDALKRGIERTLRFNVVAVTNFFKAKKIIEEEGTQFFMALVDLSLPEVLNGEVIDFFDSMDVAIVGLSSEVTDGVREYVSSQNILDYIVKMDTEDVGYIVGFIDRIYKNQATKVMVVDDSRTSRRMVSMIFKNYRFQVFEADDGDTALKVFEEHPDIKLIITDYIMPTMDGVELIRKIRGEYKKGKGDVAIIGISAFGSSILSAKFIKQGANDFLTKPFLKEEFICRINQNIEFIENFQMIKQLSEVDMLTTLYNRRYLFEVGEKIFESAKRESIEMTVAMIDIDHFKTINDTYGHGTGDAILSTVGRLLKKSFRKADLVSRVGGEEFCVITVNLKKDFLESTFERVRKAFEELEIECGDQVIRCTASLGVATVLGDSLEEMMNRADELLYKAKKGGRNRVETEQAAAGT